VETHIFDSIRNPLSAEMMVDTLPTAEEEQLIYVSSNTSLKTKFPTMSLHKFFYQCANQSKALNNSIGNICTNITVSYVHITIVAVEKLLVLHILSMCL
jgi:hypothetical protein